jgi:hypothetical protein
VDIVLLEVVVHVDEDVVVLGSEQARTGTLPKNLIVRLSRAGSLGRRGSEATAHASSVRANLALGMAESSNTEGEERRFGGNCSRKQCACKSCVGNGREQQHRRRRERSPKQKYLGVRMCICARGGSPLI